MAISIHAPTRGATITIFANFIFHIISIHAPTRGATGGVLYVNCVTRYFNPRSHKGSDHKLRTKFFSMPISIHAPTRGATVSYIAARKRFGISIHAPTRGATPMGVQYLPVSADFNPRSHKGSDAQSGTLADGIWSFQSTLPQGERQF